MHHFSRTSSRFSRCRMRFVEMPWGKIVTWMQILKTKIFKWFFICEFRDKTFKMRDKEVKEKLLFKKDNNGKRYVYISMGRFHSQFWQFLYGSIGDKHTFVINNKSVKLCLEEKLEMEKRWIQNNVIRKSAKLLGFYFVCFYFIRNNKILNFWNSEGHLCAPRFCIQSNNYSYCRSLW